MGLFKFLKSLRTLANNRNITIDEAYKFAKQEFGEVSDLLKLQINKIFKDVEAPSIKLPKKPEGKVVPIKPEVTFTPTQKKLPEPIDLSIEERTGGMIKDKTPLTKRLETGIEKLKGFKKPGKDLTTGMTRTAARVILDNAGIKVPEKVDPIDVIAKEFGVDVLMDLRDVADELIEKERTGRITESMGEFLESRGMFDLKRGRTDMPKGYTDEEMKEIEKAIEQEDMLLRFDPKDREPNATGGRVGKGSTGIFDKLEMDVPYPYGHRVEYSKGGGVKALIKMINKKFGKGTIGTAEDMAKKGELKVDPNKQKYDEDRKAVFDFNMRQLNKTEREAQKEMDEIIKDQIEGGFIRDMKKSMDEDMVRELKKPERKILDVPPVPKGFKLSKEKLMDKFPEIDENFADEVMDMDRDTQGRIIKMLENRRLDPETYDRLLAEYGDTLEFQQEFDKAVRRQKNAGGGLAYLMGL